MKFHEDNVLKGYLRFYITGSRRLCLLLLHLRLIVEALLHIVDALQEELELASPLTYTIIFLGLSQFAIVHGLKLSLFYWHNREVTLFIWCYIAG